MAKNTNNQEHTKQGGKPVAIEEMLPIGERDAIHGKDLANLLGGTERELRNIVASARNRGAIICSSSNGYFRPSNSRELHAYIRTAQACAKSIFRTLQGAKKELERIEGQYELESGGHM